MKKFNSVSIEQLREVAILHPIYGDSIYRGASRQDKLKSQVYIDTLINFEEESLGVYDLLLRYVKADRPIYWLAGIAVEIFQSLKKYVGNQDKYPSKIEYALDVPEPYKERYESCLTRASNNELYVDISYTPTATDISTNNVRLLPGIGLKEFNQMQQIELSQLNTVIGNSASDYLTNFIKKVSDDF